MHQSQLNYEIEHWVYTDKGFSWDTYVRCAAHGPGIVTAFEKRNNYIMSTVRVTEEWGFGKIKARCPFINRHMILKVQHIDVAKFVRVAVLLTNAHTCMHQSQTGLYFDCTAPTLEEYFQ